MNKVFGSGSAAVSRHALAAAASRKVQRPKNATSGGGNSITNNPNSTFKPWSGSIT